MCTSTQRSNLFHSFSANRLSRSSREKIRPAPRAQMVQELEFHAGQVQRLVVQRDFQGLGVHAQPVHTEHTVLPVRAFRKPGVFHAPQDNPDAGEQFPRGEVFGT